MTTKRTLEKYRGTALHYADIWRGHESTGEGNAHIAVMELADIILKLTQDQLDALLLKKEQ